MNKRPLILRTAIVIVVMLVFCTAMYPLVPPDFYDAYVSLLKDKKDTEAVKLVTEAKALQAKDPQLYQSQALLQAADSKGIDLTKKVKGTDLQDNRDVMSLVRKEASSSIRLGLDLNGGVEFILQLVPDEEFLKRLKSGAKGGESREEVESRMSSEFDRYRDVAIEILRKRLEGQKIFEAEIAPSGGDYVALRAPVVAKDEKLKLLELIKMSAKLHFRFVHPDNENLVQKYLADENKSFRVPGYELMKTQEFRAGEAPLIQYFFVERHVAMDGKNITMAMPTRDQFGQRKIALRFNLQGAEDFGRITSNNVGRSLAIVLDGKLYCAPRIQGAITGGSAEISGSFSEEEAKSIADALVSGGFPFQIKVNAVFDTDPQLGKSNVKNGVWVGVIGMVLVSAFMVIYYHGAGFIAVFALLLNIVLILGAMAAFNCTLTLPGIAGIVLTIGMAVDANVLVYERIREELASGKGLQNAVDRGYGKAFSAVLDANVTTLITSLILMNVGTGAIKGFAITLSIGILTSLFTALFVTRLVYDYLFRYGKITKITMMKLWDKLNIDFIGKWRISAVVVALLAIVLVAVAAVKGKENLSVDFTGGTVVTFSYAEQIPQEKIEKTLVDNGFKQARVTYKFNIGAGESGNKVEILIRGDQTTGNSESSPMDRIQKALNKAYPKAKFSDGLESSIGGLIGNEFKKAAAIAIILSMIGIGLYISLRYEWTFALAATLSLMVDVVMVLAVFLAMGRTISLSVVAALLTVIGYSVNDKVVVFDRIRENLGLGISRSFRQVVNSSINQCLSRTLITSITTFITVFVLFLGGGVAINDFVLIMMLGVILGTASSIFVAAPLLCLWHKEELNNNVPKAAKQEEA
ncbi:MAG: protein translocase subunit SecD [Lentisphaeria bacterium]|nr:protein translocase subunit SecD [Lentisphaeria bacterium]